MLAAAVLLTACGSKQSEQTIDATDIAGVWQISKPTDRLLTADGKAPPLLPEAQKIYEQRIAARKAGDLSWDLAAKCKPLGEPRAMLEMSWPFEVLHADERADIAYQWNRLVHSIPMAKEHGPAQGPFYFGESIGSWEGDTLVVDVINIRAESVLDPSGLPHSDDLHMVERFRVTNGGKNLEVKFHFEDPKTFSQPWDAVLVFDRKTDTRIAEDVCFDRLQLNDYYNLNNALK